ncbi:hypothetical protein HYY74_04050 [Candidatus Woesearchaeota archaeon]|nr:hypothetical protein [Candidatus Woesearchaeota archaeon]
MFRRPAALPKNPNDWKAFLPRPNTFVEPKQGSSSLSAPAASLNLPTHAKNTLNSTSSRNTNWVRKK